MSNIKKSLKDSSLLAWYFLAPGTEHQWIPFTKQKIKGVGMVLIVQAFLHNEKSCRWCSSFPFKAQGLTALYGRAVLIINPSAFAWNSRVSLSLPDLNLGAKFSSFLPKKCPLWHFVFQNKALPSALKTCSGRYSFSMIFLIASGNSFAVS